MTSRYNFSPTNLRALRDRLTAAAKREGVVLGRLQQHVGVLVVAQFMSSLTDEPGLPQLLVKGGASLELRRGIPESRTAKVKYLDKPFVSVPIEVSPVEAGNADAHDKIQSEALALVGLPNSEAIPCMTLPWQIAQKVHACTNPMKKPRTNDRARDLVDLQLIEALMLNESLRETREASSQCSTHGAAGKTGRPPLPHSHTGRQSMPAPSKGSRSST